MELYSAGMRHSAETVRQFTLLQYNTFEWWRKLLFFLLSAALIVFGVSSLSSLPMIFCLFAGCLILTNLDSRANSVADGVIEAMQGSYPLLRYSFSGSAFTDGANRPEVPYKRLLRLIADEKYLYLFTSKASGYMIEKESVQGPDGADGLMALISRETGLGWEKPFSLLTFRLRDLLPQGKRHGK